MTIVEVKCRCPKGHEIKSSFVKKNFNIEYEKVNQDLIGSKIMDYCRLCKGIQPLIIVSVLSMEKQ